MNEPFLNCDIISVQSLPDLVDDGWYLINRVYHYNSLEPEINVFNQYCIQIPYHEITDIHLLYGLDYEFINKNAIPIIKRVVNTNNEIWKIDLEHYENLKLQSLELL